MTDNLPNYNGCLNLLQAIYSQWWREAHRDPCGLAELADWTGQTLEQARSRPKQFHSARKGDLFGDD